MKCVVKIDKVNSFLSFIGNAKNSIIHSANLYDSTSFLYFLLQHNTSIGSYLRSENIDTNKCFVSE